MDYMPALLELKAALTTPTRPAVLNRQEINPPCVFIALRELDTWTLADCAEATVHLFVMVGDRNDEAALIALAPHLDELLALLEANRLPVERVAADQVSGTDNPTALPAFRIETRFNV